VNHDYVFSPLPHRLGPCQWLRSSLGILRVWHGRKIRDHVVLLGALRHVRHMVVPQATLFRSTHQLPLQSWRRTKAFGD
jgi:hypothetical protein